MLSEFSLDVMLPPPPPELPRPWLVSKDELITSIKGRLYAGKKRGRGKESGIKVKSFLFNLERVNFFKYVFAIF